MRKLKVYIETSVWGFSVADELFEKKIATIEFFEWLKAKEVKLYISPLVISEIERTSELGTRERLKKAIAEYKPEILEETPEIVELSEKYLSSNILPEKYRNDALHIAYVSFYELDVLVSWNLRHIVKMRTRQMVNYVNMIEGYRMIEIVTPEEVIVYEEE